MHLGDVVAVRWNETIHSVHLCVSLDPLLVTDVLHGGLCTQPFERFIASVLTGSTVEWFAAPPNASMARLGSLQRHKGAADVWIRGQEESDRLDSMWMVWKPSLYRSMRVIELVWNVEESIEWEIGPAALMEWLRQVGVPSPGGTDRPTHKSVPQSLIVPEAD